MIEFLPPRDGAFGDRDAADFVGLDGDEDAAWGDDEPPRSRWLTALAVLGVTGLLAGGVIAAAPWDATDTATPPTTAAPTTTVRTRPPSLSDIATDPTLPRDWPTTPAGWIPTEDSPFQVVYAYSSGEDTSLFDPTWGNAVTVFAADGPIGRATGRWLAIDAAPAGMSYGTMRRGGVVTVAGERQVIVSSSEDGVVSVEVELFDDTGDTPVRVVGFGVGLDAMLGVAAEVDLAWTGNVRRLDLDAVESTGALAGLVPRIAVDQINLSFDGEHGIPMAMTDLTDGASWARAAVIRQNPEQAQLSELLLRTPLDTAALPIDLQRRLDELARRGLPIALSRVVDSGVVTGRAQLTADTALLVSTDGTVADVVRLLGSMRPATDDEWVDLLTQSANDLLTSPTARNDDPFVQVGSGTNWSSEISRSHFSLGTATSGVWERFSHGQGPELVEYRSFDVAFLRATTTFPNEARLVVVTQEGADPQRAKLVEIPDAGVLAAVVELDPTLPYTVAWVDTDDQPVDGPVDAAASQASRTEAAP